MRNTTTWSCGLALALLLLHCGPPTGPRTPTAHELRSLTEAQALQIVAQVVREAGRAPNAAFDVSIGEASPMEVDVRLDDTRFAIEWVSAQDRERLGDALPAPVPGQLRILPGAGDDAQIEILLLDEATYRYDPDRERNHAGSRGLSEVEGRLRGDVRDFLAYCS